MTAAQVDNGSFDPDGDPFGLVLQPPGPYPAGDTPVQLVVTDSCGMAAACGAVISVSCPVGPLQAVAPTAVLFASVAYGDTVCDSVFVRNVGDQLLTVSAITGCGADGYFLDLTGIDSTVAPGDSTALRVCYSPTITGPDSCRIVVVSDGGTDSVSVRALSVSAVEGPARPDAARRPLTVGPVIPSPFRGSVEIGFRLAEPAIVRGHVFDAQGRRVAALLDGEFRAAGFHRLNWNGEDSGGRPVRAGIYYVRLTAGAFTESIPVVRLR